MYRPYAIRPVWEMRRAAQAVAKCYGGGTSSTPTVPPEFRPLIEGSVNRMLGQQRDLPINSFNAPNPMGVEGMTPGQQFGMSWAAGNMQQSPFQAIALQAAQRAAGMGGQGPTTGMYDPSGEMSLQDWANLGNHWQGFGGEMGDNPLASAMGGQNQAGRPDLGGGMTPDGSGGSIGDMLAQLFHNQGVQPGGPTGNTGGPPTASGAASPGVGAPSLGSTNDASLQDALASHDWAAVQAMERANPVGHDPNAGPIGSTGSYQTPDGQTRWADPRMAGRTGQFGAGHTLGGYDSQGRVNYFADQNSSQGAPGHVYQNEAPSDPALNQAYQRQAGKAVSGGGGFGSFGKKGK